MTKHTPRPWTHNGDDERTPTAVWTADPSTKAKLICLVGEPHILSAPIGKREQTANACLIAAAPDLLAALAMARNYYGDGIDTEDAEEMSVHDAMNAAIARATGEA